jgi:hypothetical protein
LLITSSFTVGAHCAFASQYLADKLRTKIGKRVIDDATVKRVATSGGLCPGGP